MLMETASFTLVCDLLWPLQDGKQTQDLLISLSCASPCASELEVRMFQESELLTYSHDACLTESPFIAKQGIIVTHALNYYDKFF